MPIGIDAVNVSMNLAAAGRCSIRAFAAAVQIAER
jgi:hypothetical protein